MILYKQNSALYPRIITKLKDIQQALIRQPSKSLGLMGGDAGKCLFLLHYAIYTSDDGDLEIAHDGIKNILSNLKSTLMHGASFSSGSAGLGWFLQHLNNIDILEVDFNEFLNTLDEALYPVMLDEIENGNYDYLHGAIGIGLYYISRFKSNKNSKYLEKLVLAINTKAIRDDGYTYWYNYDSQIQSTSVGIVNLGLAHGVPSILQFLIKVNQAKILPDLTSKLISSTQKFLLKYANPFEKEGSHYPYIATINKSTKGHSRLAWCYGDLGVCNAIFNALPASNKNEFLLEMMLNQTKRKDLEMNSIRDTEFCHGTSGIAYMLKKYYEYTNIEEFKNAAIFWYDKTLSMDVYPDGLAGYKTYVSEINPVFINNESLIEGIAGTGLSLLSTITDTPSPLDEVFLIN